MSIHIKYSANCTKIINNIVRYFGFPVLNNNNNDPTHPDVNNTKEDWDDMHIYYYRIYL